jgi:hypothetical protein
LQVEQAAVLWVQIGKQRVVQRQCARRGCAGQLQGQHGVGAVGVLVDLLRAHAQRARHTVGGHGQARTGIGGDVGMALAHLAPGDGAVAIGIQPDGHVQVAQRDVPAARDAALGHIQGEIAV